MKFGAHYLPTYVPDLDGPVAEFYQRMFVQMEEMDRLGYDHIWVTEHHFATYGGTLPQPPVFLAAVARTTQRVRLGVAINVLPLHNPLEVAETYAMVDVISNGRLDFGVGKGSESHEYKKFGVSQQEATGRMTEGMEILRQAWSDKPVQFKGEFFHYEGVPVLPKPVQRPHPPIWVGCARSEESFRWAGENGFHLMTLPYLYRDPQTLPRFVRAYRDGLARAGHDFTATEVLGKFHIYVSSSLDRAVQEAGPYLENYVDVHRAADPQRRESGLLTVRDPRTQLSEGFVIAGDPERCIDTIEKWRSEVGLTAISGTFHFGGMPQEMALKNIRLFAERVMPEFK
ncbi:MAG TPA: LLM class flavin-dependent oxidoreductase [candidate division Zixibacteria bacterium]|nr:LLM class flavin-dependent oxidoreductase [candidate division Zixibacteria bacterium]